MVENPDNNQNQDITDVPHGPYPAVKPRSALRQTVLSLMILVFGGLIGAGSTYLIVKRPPPPPDPTHFAMEAIKEMKEKIAITAQQEKQLKDVFISHFKTMGEKFKEFNAGLTVEREKFLANIEKVLTQEQFEVYKKIFEEKVRRWNRWRSRGPGRGRGPRDGRDDNRRGPGEGDGRRGDGRRGPRDGQRFRPGGPADGRRFGPDPNGMEK